MEKAHYSRSRKAYDRQRTSCSSEFENKKKYYKKLKESQIHFTLVSSELFNTYVNLFSLRGRVELALLPALPTRCIATTPETNMNKQYVNNKTGKNEKAITISILLSHRQNTKNLQLSFMPGIAFT